MSTYDDCTSISPACPVEATTLGYYPSLGANATFLAINVLCAIFQLIFGIRYRTWFFMGGLVCGCILQTVGYVGRIMMHSNPWSSSAFTMQITCLILGPAFISASIYITLKHFALTFGSQYSWIKPKWYTWIFVTADLLAIALQGAGGGIASSAETQSDSDLGGHIMLAGIIWQVVSLAAFGILGLVYAARVWRNKTQLTQAQKRIASSTTFRAFLAAVVLAYTTILIRCIYRIPELAGGWASELMQNETDFVVLDSVMTLVAVVVLTIAHPGFCFVQMTGRYKQEPELVAPVEKGMALRSDSEEAA